MKTRQILRSHVEKALRTKGLRRPISDHSRLITSGLLDSMDILGLAAVLEERWGVDFSRVPFQAADLDTINDMILLLQRLGKVDSP